MGSKVNDNLPFQFRRIRRLLIVILGRVGVWKFCFWIIRQLLKFKMFHVKQ